MATRKYLAADGTPFDTAKQADSHDLRKPHLDALCTQFTDGDAARALDILMYFESNFRLPATRAPRKPKEAGAMPPPAKVKEAKHVGAKPN